MWPQNFARRRRAEMLRLWNLTCLFTSTPEASNMISAVDFLKEHGSRSLVSLGCGERLNRIDNHLKLLLGCGLQFYVGIDRTSRIEFDLDDAFVDKNTAVDLLAASNGDAFTEVNCAGLPPRANGDGFRALEERIQVFPDTHVEEMAGIHCGVVVCQRVWPFRHWEHIIKSMQPMLMLQEDLHGCELQDIGGKHYTRSRAGILHYGLVPFRPYRIFPGERNLILWRRRDFFTCRRDMEPWWTRLYRKITQ
jgi:hypothetical protein